MSNPSKTDLFVERIREHRSNNRDEFLKITTSDHTITNEEGNNEKAEGVDISIGKPYMAIAIVFTGLCLVGAIDQIGIRPDAQYLTETALVGVFAAKIAARAKRNTILGKYEAAYAVSAGNEDEQKQTAVIYHSSKDMGTYKKAFLTATTLLMGSSMIMEMSNNFQSTPLTTFLGIVGGLTTIGALVVHGVDKLLAEERGKLVDKIAQRRGDNPNPIEQVEQHRKAF